MREAVHVAGSENKTAAELERILAEPVLFVSGRFGALSGGGVLGAKQMENVRRCKPGDPICLALFIDQQREINSGILAKHAGVVAVAQADRREVCSRMPERGFVFAQLRDVLAAENSTVVTQEHDDGGLIFP